MRRPFVILLALALTLSTSLNAYADPPQPKSKTWSPIVQSVPEKLLLEEALDQHQIKTAQALGIWAGPNHVRLMVEGDGLEELPPGTELELRSGKWQQMRIPRSQVQILSADPAVRQIRPPLPHRPAFFSEGVFEPSDLNRWHASGWTGQGVKVAVIDVGFAGWQTLQSNGELPGSGTLAIKNFRADGNFESDPHGSAVAEIVHDAAPGADIHLYAFDTELELEQAVQWAIYQGVDIIVHSISWFNTGSGDGSGYIADLVRSANGSGILWVNAAGNQAQRHYTSFFSADTFNWHQFQPGDISNEVSLNSGETLCVWLSWDGWPATADDYDLFLFYNGGILAYSVDIQNGTQPPTEALCYTAHFTGGYDIRIKRDVGVSRALRLFSDGGSTLEYASANGSIAQPADAAEAFGIGASFWNPSYEYEIEAFSGRGPTSDGRTKPDMVAYDGVTTATFGMSNRRPYFGGGTGYFGTSAAAPHVAGAAAVLMDRYPSWSNAETQFYLRSSAIDMGAIGPDNTYGAGRLFLPLATATQTDTPTITPTPTHTLTPTHTPTATNTPTSTPTLPPSAYLPIILR